MNNNNLEINTDVCNNCNKFISNNIFEIHCLYCFKFMIKCFFCDEMIHKDIINNHNNDHSIENEKLDKKKLIENFQKCKFCENFIDSDYNKHLMYCGSRTQKCENCNLSIIMKFYNDHLLICNDSDLLFAIQQSLKIV
jgi:hypothetical protein